MESLTLKWSKKKKLTQWVSVSYEKLNIQVSKSCCLTKRFGLSPSSVGGIEWFEPRSTKNWWRCHRCCVRSLPNVQAHTFPKDPKRAHNTRDHFPVRLRILFIAFFVVAAIASTPERQEGDFGNLSVSTSIVFKGDLDRRSWIVQLRETQCVSSTVAEQFNSASYSLDDIMVCSLKQCSGSNISRKQHEMKFILMLGTRRIEH